MKLRIRDGTTKYECVPNDRCNKCELRFKCYTSDEFIFLEDLTEHEVNTFFKVSGIWDMSHNKRKAMKKALFYLEEIIKIDKEDPAALPGSVLRHVKSAKTLIKKDKMMQKEIN